jgi:outer membrane protein, multidrug efflux system
LGLTVLGLSACVDRGGTRATAELPAVYEQSGPATAAATAAATVTAAGVVGDAARSPDAADFPDFGSATLAGLLARADRDNADIGIAVARVRQADAKARQSGAALLPTLDFSPNGTGYAGGAHGRHAHEVDWSAAFAASYELDLWGKLGAQRDAATAAAHATRADFAAARMTARAGIANLFFQAQSARERFTLANDNLQTTQDVLAYLEPRAALGLVTPAELASQRALVATARLALPELAQQRVELLAALALLVGSNPEGFDVPDEPLDALHEPTLAGGLPSDLLTRRPDIVAAEDALSGAHADLRAARAAFFPDISLSATGGVANPAVNAAVNVLAGTGYSFTLGADLVQSIFDGGRRRAVAAEAEAREQEMLLTYRAAIRAALADVETALAQLHHLDEQRAAEEANVVESARAFDGWNARYHAGAVAYVSVLEAQRTLIAARDRRAQYQLARLQSLVNLDKALGGQWIDPTRPALTAAVP